MARKFRKIDPRIWTDEGFSRLDGEGKLLAFWMLTSSRVNRCGLVIWSPALASEETGIPRDRVDTVLDTVSDTLSWAFHRPSRVVFLTRWWRYNRPDNESALKGALADLHDLPRNDLKAALEEAKSDLPKELHTVYQTVLDTVYPTVSPQEKEKEKEKEQEQEKEPLPSEVVGAASGPAPRGTAKRFSPPTVEEVEHYCRERGNGVDARKFVDHYAAKGWKIGKTPMKDWRAAVRTWEQNDDRRPNFPRAESLAEKARRSTEEFLGEGEPHR